MKNFVSGMVLVLLVELIVSCVSPPTITDPYKPLNGVPNTTVIGTVQTEFNLETASAYLPGAYPGADKARRQNADQAAYIALLASAKKEFFGNIDIVDITWVFSRIEGKGYVGKYYYSATGKVVSLGGGSGRSTATGVEGALARAAGDVSKDFPSRARIAIVQITASDRSTRDYMIGELEHILRGLGYYMVDRAQLDRIFEEQRFGTTSDVDDNTAARMGKIAGEGNLRRLRLRALNTETAQVVGTASERL